MSNTFPHINNLIEKLYSTRDIAVALKLANAIMDVLNEGTPWKLREPEDIFYNCVIPNHKFRNEKQLSWFNEHFEYEGQRVALYHFDEKTAPYESKFYQLNKNATKAVVAAGVMLTPNWEDSKTTQNKNYKVGIDFFLNKDDDGLLMVASDKLNLRVLEFREKLTNTQIEILNNLRGLGTIKGLDASGNFASSDADVAEPALEPQRAIHKKLWDSLALKTINKKFFIGIAEHFSSLYLSLVECGIEVQTSKVFATRLIGRILFCWFLAKKSIIDDLPESFDTFEKLEELFYGTLNTPVEERVNGDKKTPYLNGGLFERRSNDMSEDQVNLPSGWLTSLYSHLQEYNFTTDESSPEYQQVAIDPEMLGCVFESLLGQTEGDIDTTRSERKQTGAFYTPREIVSYMCKEALREHLYSSTPDAMHNQVDAILDRSDSHWLTNHSNSLRDIADVRGAVLDACKNYKVLDPACGSGAFPMGMLQLILKVRGRVEVESNTSTHDIKKEILQNNIYGVDINPMAVEISKLRSWLSLEIDNANNEPLPNLNFKFVCANSLIGLSKDEGVVWLSNGVAEHMRATLANVRDEYFNARTREHKEQMKKEYKNLVDTMQEELPQYGYAASARQLANWDPWDLNTPAEFFDSTEMFSVPLFDCVIGNPPYVQIQKLDKDVKTAYKFLEPKSKKERFETFDSMGDVYCLFYERAKDFLREGGTCAFITSNKWMRAGYGEKLRNWFLKEINPSLLVDLGSGVFDSATVDTNILVFKNEPNSGGVRCALAKTSDALSDLTQYARDNVSLMNFNKGESWVVLSDIEKSIKEKVERHGKPLKDWNIKINRGILTGCNEAFIVDGATKDKLIEQDSKSAELLKPILRGRDIHRFSYDFADKWLIASHNGYVADDGSPVPSVNVDDYPAIKSWLDSHWDKIAPRQDQGCTPYNLRNCAYWADFEREKIVWSDISTTPSFCFVKQPILVANTGYILTGAPDWMVDYLNSRLIGWYYPIISANLGESGSRYTKQFIEKIPVPETFELGDTQDFETALMQKLELTSEEVEFLTSTSSLRYASEP